MISASENSDDSTPAKPLEAEIASDRRGPGEVFALASENSKSNISAIDQPNIGEKTAKGAMWMSIAQVITRGVGSFRIVVLAAILPLPELGLFGIAAVVMQLVEQLSETGIRQALIQHPKDDVSEYLGTVWVSQISRGAIVSLAMMLSAGTIESFFGKPGVAHLLLLLAIIPLVQGLQNVGILHLQRELRFKKIVYLQLSIALTDLSISVLLSLIWPLAISLVIGKISATLVGLAFSFFLESRRASFSFSMAQFRELYKFGFWVFLSAILSFTLIRGGDLVVGKLLSQTDLAIYQIAYGLACIPIMEIMTVVSMTTFSAYSRIQHDPPRLARAFLRVLALSSFIAMFSIVGFLTLSVDFTKTFFKPELMPIAQMLPWLAVWGACRALGATNTVLFQAVGRPALAAVFPFLMVGLFVVLLIPMAMAQGTMGVAIALAIIGVTAQLGRYAIMVSVLPITGAEIFKRIMIPIVLGASAFVPAYLLLASIGESMSAIRMVVGLVTITVIYFLGTLLIDRKMNFGLIDFFAMQVPGGQIVLRWFHLAPSVGS